MTVEVPVLFYAILCLLAGWGIADIARIILQ